MLIAMPVFAGYKIVLKNGKGFTVNNYTEADGKIRFYMGGGLIELDRSIIESIREIKSRSSTYESAPEETVKQDPTVGIDSLRKAYPAAEKGKDSQTKGDGAQTKRQEITDRLKEIGKKKEALGLEDKKIADDRKKLEDDKQKEGRVTSIPKKREFEKRADEISDKIRKFNEELNRLDDEEGKLIKELKGTGTQ